MGQKLSDLKGFFGVMDNGNCVPTNYANEVPPRCEDSAPPPVHCLEAGADQRFESIYNNGAGADGGGPWAKEENGNRPASESCGCPARSECSYSGEAGAAAVAVAVGRAGEAAAGAGPGPQSSSTAGRRCSVRTLSLAGSKRSRGKGARSPKDLAGSKKKRNHWVLRFNCARLKGGAAAAAAAAAVAGAGVGAAAIGPEPDAEPAAACEACVCTGYRRTEDSAPEADPVPAPAPAAVPAPTPAPELVAESLPAAEPRPADFLIDMSKFNPDDYPTEDCDERARRERAREMAEGVEPPPGFCPGRHIQLVCPQQLTIDNLTALFQTHLGLSTSALTALSQLDISLSPAVQRAVHTQVDYVHCLVPDLLQITACSYYWGKMDRYEAERLLEGRPEGTFLLRDSAQEEYLFSVSFRKYGRSLHARIEQWNHQFSFDSHDPGVYASRTVCGLIEHYKDPSCCMFFEPMLTIPLHRTFPFPLQHLCRSVVCSRTDYDGLNRLQLPKALKGYLKEYHYKQRVRVRRLDLEH